MLFDTTDPSLARQYKLEPREKVIICVGENQLILGLDEDVLGKEVGKKYTVKLPATKAFGKKDVKLIKMVNTAVFKKQGIPPQPGLQVTIDGQYGMIRTVTGGRTLVDFNHPLAGKEVSYEYTVTRKVDDKKEQLESFLFSIIHTSPLIEVSGDKATIKLNLPDEVKQVLADKIKDVVKIDVEFVQEEKVAKETSQAAPINNI